MIKVDTVCMEAQAQEMQRIANELNNIISRVDDVKDNLRWNTNVSGLVRTRLSNHKKGIADLDEKTEMLKNILLNAVNYYTDAERKIEYSDYSADGNSEKNHDYSSDWKEKIFVDWSNVINYIRDALEQNQGEDNLFDKWIKSIIDKYGITDNRVILPLGLPFLMPVATGIYKDVKNITGVKDICNLTDNYLGFSKTAYDIVKKVENGVGEAFSITNQKIMGGIGVVASGMGFLGEAMEAKEDICNSDDIGPAGIIGKIFGVGAEGVEVGVDAYELGTISTAANANLYSPAKIYTSIAKGYMDAVGQGFESYEEYIADGKWDLMDTASTGMDASVTGLYSMANTLTFGLVSEDVIGVNAEDISDGLKNIAKGIGTDAGNYIKNNESLHEMYNESNKIGQAALITYAAIRTRF